MKEILVSVSSLPAENDIEKYVKQIEQYADFLHCDFMDGTITNASTKLSSTVVSNINKISTLPLDVHIMSKFPKKYIDDFINAKANIITIHYESFENNSQIIKCLKYIKSKNVLCGLAVNIGTNIDLVLPLLKYCDIVLIMCVNIGKYGQSFDSTALDKVKVVNKFRKDNHLSCKIEVDGGINNQNCSKIISCGADILVSGGYISNETNYQLAINNLKK